CRGFGNNFFIYDRKDKPIEKHGIKVINDNDEILLYRKSQPLIEAFEYHCHNALGNGEAELVWMNQKGIIDAIMTMDADVFPLGAKCVLCIVPEKCSETKIVVDVYQADCIATILGLTQLRLILYALLVGNDFNNGVLGIGPEIAYGLALAGIGWGNKQLLLKFRERVWAGLVLHILYSPIMRFCKSTGEFFAPITGGNPNHPIPTLKTIPASTNPLRYSKSNLRVLVRLTFNIADFIQIVAKMLEIPEQTFRYHKQSIEVYILGVLIAVVTDQLTMPDVIQFLNLPLQNKSDESGSIAESSSMMKATHLQVISSANSDIEEVAAYQHFKKKAHSSITSKAAQDDSDDIEFGEIIQPPASACKQLYVQNESDSDFKMGELFPAVIHP
ncbi:hypothetical protein Moror_15164, partial [Moniliophthora roreri MCA 2997]